MQPSDPQTAGCIFCAIVRSDAPATFLHQDELVVAIMQPGRAALEAIADQIRRGSSQLSAPDTRGD
jgi:hypothetical protein